MTTPSTSALYEKATAFDIERTEEEAKEWSWEQYGSEGLALIDFVYGAKNLSSRRKPVDDAVKRLVEAVEKFLDRYKVYDHDYLPSVRDVIEAEENLQTTFAELRSACEKLGAK